MSGESRFVERNGFGAKMFNDVDADGWLIVVDDGGVYGRKV